MGPDMDNQSIMSFLSNSKRTSIRSLSRLDPDSQSVYSYGGKTNPVGQDVDAQSVYSSKSYRKRKMSGKDPEARSVKSGKDLETLSTKSSNRETNPYGPEVDTQSVHSSKSRGKMDPDEKSGTKSNRKARSGYSIISDGDQQSQKGDDDLVVGSCIQFILVCCC